MVILSTLAVAIARSMSIRFIIWEASVAKRTATSSSKQAVALCMPSALCQTSVTSCGKSYTVQITHVYFQQANI